MATMLRSPVARGDDAATLHAILDPGCSLAIWDRRLPVGLADQVARLDPEGVDDIDAVVRADNAMLEAAVPLGAAGYEGAAALALAAEIGVMADCVMAIAPVESLRIRLEIVETDACRRFHVDMVTMRLLATLRGPGTQWIETARPDVIEQLPTGTVAIFKGRLLADEPAVLHRSPSIAGTDQCRLVLVIDPA